MMLKLRIAARMMTLFALLTASLGVVSPPRVEGATPVRAPDASLTRALPAWFDNPSATEAPTTDLLPSWFASDGWLELTEEASGQPATVVNGASNLPAQQGVLPTWFALGKSSPSDDAGARFGPLGGGESHQTIYPNQITVTIDPPAISLCEPLTVTVVAASDAVTTTGVLLTVTLPGGFTSSPQVFNVGSVQPNEVITRAAVFTATCSAVSGQAVVTLTQDAYPPIVKLAEYVINPGAITVRKEPSIAPASIGDVVTWTVYVENTGYGTVYNVAVTDTLGPGLQFVSGLTSTSYVSIPVGQTASFTVAAQVVACSGLENSVVAAWGCPGQTCLTPQTAKAAIDLLPRFPDLEYSLPSFDVNYCGGSSVFTVPITNTGDGTAYSVTLPVNLSPFSVGVASPATYAGGAFQVPPIPPGQTFNLVFTLTLPSNACATPAGGSFNFDINYRDACNFLYAEAPQVAAWQLVNIPGQLSVSKDAPTDVYRGQAITTPITVNANGISGAIVVTDQVPAGAIVLDAGGGVTFTLGGATYISWTLGGSAVLTPVFVVPTNAASCAACGSAFTNIVTATARDCQNCQQTATAQSTTYIQCNDAGAQSAKLVSSPAPVCSSPAFTHTNIYTFAGSFVVTPTWGGLIFTETLVNQAYVSGTAQVWASDGVTACAASFSSAVIGGQLVITDINPPCNPNVAGATLIISYTTASLEANSCSDAEWYDWSYLNLGTSGNGVCAGGDVIAEGALMQTEAPRMTLNLSGLPPNVSSCGVYTVTLTAQRASSLPGYDAAIVVPTSTYAVLDVLGFSGATPAFTQTDSLGYRWFYSDAFTNAVTATVQLRVQLRCGSAPAPFSATLHYESLCTNNDTYFERCNTGGALATPPRLAPLPLLTKFPETIYATGDVVTWTLIAKNTGAGPAHGVVLTDLLGSGLSFVTATITSSLGSPAGINLITSTNLVTWEVPVIQPQETLTIRYVAEIVSCTDLTNRLFGAQGCLGQVCLSGGPVTSVVELPPTVLLNTNQTFSPIETCFTRTVTATVRNAGLLSVYSATVTQTLPVGLFYVPGSTQISTDTLSWQPGPDPTIGGQNLSWGPTSTAPLGAWLARLRPKDTVYLRYDVRASCGFEGGALGIQTGYRDVCGAPYTTASSSYALGVKRADLSLAKIGQNLSRTSPSNVYLYAEPGEVVVFTITVANAASAAPAQLLVITDALSANLAFQSATPGYSGPAPGPLGGTITWSLPLLNPGNTAVFTVTAVVSQPNGCAITDTFNVASLSWGCPDGCRLTLPAQQVRVRTRPVYDEPGIQAEIAPAALNVCGGAITVTLYNDGPPAYNVVLTNTLPSGYVFSSTLSASAPPSGVVDLGSSVVYTWAALPSGATTITLQVRNANTSGACAVAGGPFTATLSYDDDAPDCPASGPYSATTTLNISAQAPNLVVAKRPTTQLAAAGQTVTWTVYLTNTGPGVAYDVVLTDVAGSAFVSLTGTNGANVSGNTLTWTIGALAPNAVFTALVSAVVTSTGVNRNVVTATARCEAGCTTSSSTGAAFVSLGDVFDKGPDAQTGTIGSLVVFTFTGFTSDADNFFEQVRLTDTLPAGLGYIGARLAYTVDLDGGQGGPTATFDVAPTSAPALYASGPIVWSLGTLTGSVQIQGVVTAVIQNVAQAFDGASLTNTLTLSFVDDGQTSVLSDTARVDVLEPLLHLGKTYLTPYGCGGTLMADDFNRASSSPPSGWTAAAGAWNNLNGVAQWTGGAVNNAVLVRSGLTADEFSFSGMSLATDATSSRGLVFRYTSGNYYLLRLRQSDGGTQLELQEFAGGFATLSTAAFTPQTNRWYHLEAQVENVPNGARIRAYVDGQLYFDIVDTTPRPPGSVGFFANNCAANACRFDDALVTRLNRAGCFVGAGDQVTYTLTISNQSRWPGYDLLITDVVPSGLSLVTYTLSTNDPSAPAVLAGPSIGASGVLTWLVSHLTPTVPFTSLQHTALTLTVVLQVAPWITANTVLSNHAFLRYDAWLSDTQPISTIARGYSGGSHAAAVQTADGSIAKSVQFAPPPTATLGTLVTYTLIVPATPITATLYNVVVTDAVDSRMSIEAVAWSGGVNGAASWSGQQVTATFDAILSATQALITVTARISHEFPSPAADANAGDVLTNAARMSHSAAPITTSNVVSTVVGEPNVLVAKSVESSAGLTTGLDGLAYLTYTIRLTNTGSAPAYSVYVTDALPAGISVTAMFGGDSQSPPAAGPGFITWYVSSISNAAPANVAVLTYTARISQALLGRLLTNTVGVLYHSLTDTTPGVRPYTDTAAAVVQTGAPSMTKLREPFELRVGDLVTYQVVFTIPAGAAWGGSSGDVLLDALPPGVWYITDTETLAHTPSAVNVTITQRISNTTEQPGQQVIRWFFAPITSTQDAPTVVTLTFRAQAVGLRIDTLAPVWITQTSEFWPTNYAQLEYPWPNYISATATSRLIQPRLTIDKDSAPPPGAFVGADDLITYILTITNDGYGPAYDVVISDVLPAGLALVTAALATSAPPTATFLAQPPVSATGTLTWLLSALWGTAWNGNQPGVAVITVVAQVTETIGANLTLTNSAAIPNYDSQPGDGPGPYAPDERDYTDGGDSVSHRTTDAALLKSVVPPTVTLGTLVTYTLIVPATPISATLNAVTVTDQLDARLQLHAVSAPGGSVVIVGNAFTVTYASIPANAQRLITVTAVVSSPLGANAGDVLTNVATLRHQDGGPVPSNQTTLTVTEPSLTLVKSSEPPTSSTVGAGQTVTYTVRITNAAGAFVSAAYDLVFSDTLPLHMRDAVPVLASISLNSTPVSGSEYTSTYDALSGALIITLTTPVNVPPGGELVITYTATVDADAPAGLDQINAASVTWSSLPSATPGDRNYGPITDSTNVHLGFPALELRKVFTPTAVEAGGLLTYTLAVTNAGVVSATGVVITDALPANTSFVSCAPAPCGESGGVVSWTVGIVDVGQSRVVTLLVQVASPLPNGSLIVNTGYITSAEGITDTDTVTTVVGSLPILNLTKSSQDGNGPPLRPGDTLTYTLVVLNTGNATANNVVVSDTVPAFTTYVPGSIAGGDARSDAALPLLTWTINALPPGVPVTLTFAVTVATPLTNGLAIANTAALTSTETPTPTSATVTDTVTASLTLQLDKQAQPDPVGAGALLTFTLRYTVSGDAPALGVVVSDATPANTVFFAAIPPATSDPGAGNAGAVIWSLGDVLAPAGGITQASGVLTMVVQVASPLVSGTQIVNAALIAESSGITSTDTATTSVVSSHTLSVSKEATPTIATAGALLTYTLRYTVSGNQPAPAVLITDTLPPSVTFQSCMPSCGVSGSVITWALGTLNPPTSGVLTVVVSVNSAVTAPAILTNVVGIGDGSGLTDTDTVETPVETRAEIALTKAATPSVATAGGLLTYTLLVTNSGPSDAQNVVVTDTLPMGVSLVSTAPPAVAAGQLLTWTLGALPAGQSIVLTAVAQVSAALPTSSFITNTAVVTTTTPGDDPSNNMDDVTTPVNSQAEIALTKHSAVSITVPGAAVTFTLVVTNYGPSLAQNAIVTDTLDVGLVYSTAVPTPSSVSGNTLVWSLGNLGAGQSIVITVVVRISPTVGYGQPLTNTAQVTTDTPGDNPSNNASQRPVLSVQPSLAIKKTLVGQDTDPIAPNHVTFTIRVTNTGPSAITPLRLRDQFDGAKLAYASATPAPQISATGTLTWSDLTGSAPHGYGAPLLPGQSFVITVTFRVISDITTTVNYASVQAGTQDEYGNPTTMPDDSAEVNNVPTAVTLRVFYVAAVNGRQVTLAWETETEQDNFAFRLYRAPSNDFAQAEFIGQVAAAMGGTGGASYTFEDTAPADGVWWYWLADVDTAGKETRHPAPVYAPVGLSPRLWLPIVIASPRME